MNLEPKKKKKKPLNLEPVSFESNKNEYIVTLHKCFKIYPFSLYDIFLVMITVKLNFDCIETNYISKIYSFGKHFLIHQSVKQNKFLLPFVSCRIILTPKYILT